MAPKNPEPSEKSEATEQTVSVKLSDLRALMDRIEKLEATKAEDIEITTELPQATGLQPGQYVNIAPANAAPELRKVRWTKATIEKTYPIVPLTPRINIVVAPHGVPWELRADEPMDVPSIVRDFHDAEVNRIKYQYVRYRPESPMEIMEAISRSREQKGQPVWGRLHIVGDGLLMNDDQPGVTASSETKA